MMHRTTIFFFIFAVVCASSSFAQQRPFLYSVSIPEKVGHGIVVHLEGGFGSGSLGSPESVFVDRRAGMLWRAGERWTLLAQAGAGEYPDHSLSWSGQAEIFYSLMRSRGEAFKLDVGGGARWEKLDGNVALLHVVSGYRAPSWLLQTNVLFEKASSPQRDPIDLIVSAGWLYRISPQVGIGVETVGQDLEGLWETEEAEGGARILSGPSMHFYLGLWEAGIAGGYVFRPTFNSNTSGANRPFGSNRMAIQFSISKAL